MPKKYTRTKLTKVEVVQKRFEHCLENSRPDGMPSGKRFIKLAPRSLESSFINLGMWLDRFIDQQDAIAWTALLQVWLKANVAHGRPTFSNSIWHRSAAGVLLRFYASGRGSFVTGARSRIIASPVTGGPATDSLQGSLFQTTTRKILRRRPKK